MSFTFNIGTPVWQRLILQVDNASNFLDRRPVMDWWTKFGVSAIIVKGSHGTQEDDRNVPFLDGPQFKPWKDAKLPFSVWHFGTGEDPAAQALQHVSLTRRWGTPSEKGNRWTILNNEFEFNAIAGQSGRYVQRFRDPTKTADGRSGSLTMQAAIQPEGAHHLHPTLGPLPVHAEYAAFVGAGFRSIPQAYWGDMTPIEPWKPWYGQARKDGYGAGFPSSYVRWTTPTASDNPLRPPASWYRTQMLELKRVAAEKSLSFPRGIVVYLGETVTDDELSAISREGYALGMLRS